MFERYTEKARRVIFFARYEASQFGAPAIEPEHLLLGLMREDKTLTSRFFPRASVTIEAIRKEIEGRTLLREKISTSVELPLAPETKRVLAYAHEESDRLQHRHIGTEHLLLGLLREDRSMAAELLYERGLRLNAARNEIAREELESEQQELQSKQTATTREQPSMTVPVYLDEIRSSGFRLVALSEHLRREWSRVDERHSGNDVLDKPKYEQKKSKEQRAMAESRRRYILALLFASIFI